MMAKKNPFQGKETKKEEAMEMKMAKGMPPASMKKMMKKKAGRGR